MNSTTQNGLGAKVKGPGTPGKYTKFEGTITFEIIEKGLMNIILICFFFQVSYLIMKYVMFFWVKHGQWLMIQHMATIMRIEAING